MVSAVAEYIMNWEGFRSKPYRCTAGRLTIGYGRNIQDNSLTTEELRVLFPEAESIQEANQKLYQGISSKQALILLKRELLDNRKLLMKFDWYRKLTDNRKIVIQDMCYNLGFAGLLKFNKMIKAIKKGDYNEAADQIKNSRYYEQVGNRAESNCRAMRVDSLPEFIGIRD